MLVMRALDCSEWQFRRYVRPKLHPRPLFEGAKPRVHRGDVLAVIEEVRTAFSRRRVRSRGDRDAQSG